MDEREAGRRWPPRLQVVAAVGWSSFLAACVGTMLLFAALDPQLIVDAWAPRDGGIAAGLYSRTGIYSAGFFFLWLVAALAGALTAYLGPGSLARGAAP